MYFLRLRRLPFTVGVLIGLFLPLPEPYSRWAVIWALVCATVFLVEHSLMLLTAIRLGGRDEGIKIWALTVLGAGLTLPEFVKVSDRITQKVSREMEAERLRAGERATRQAAEREARQQALEASIKRDQLARAVRLREFLEQARPFGDEHVAHLTQLFSRNEADLDQATTDARTYLARTRGRHAMLAESERLDVRMAVSAALERDDEAGACQILAEASAKQARHLELRSLKAEVERSPPHLRGHLNELLAQARAQLGNARDFRKAAYALRQALPKNGHSAHR